MPSLVIDPSVAAAWCFKDEATAYTDGVLGIVSGPGEAIAPRLFAYELRNSVLMGVRRGRVVSKVAQEFLQSLLDLRIRMTDPTSYDAVFDLAERRNLTVYDAAYLDLAIREGLPLASLDAALIRAASASGGRGISSWIDLLSQQKALTGRLGRAWAHSLRLVAGDRPLIRLFEFRRRSADVDFKHDNAFNSALKVCVLNLS